MSKSKFIKILVATLTLCLLLGAAIGVSAFAAEEGGAEEYTIKKISKNVEYGSRTYLYYAVAEEYIPEADRAEGKVWMNVYNADGSFAFKQFPEAELVYIDVLKANCYIFKTRGVPAKELNTIEMVQVVTESGAKSALESYSVEEYLYQKLYNEGYALKTEADVGADGKDYKRRTLYYDLLKYGAVAQELLAPDATDKIGVASYLDVTDAALKGGFVPESSDRIIIRYDGERENEFDAWEFVRYDDYGELVDSGYAMDGAIFLNAPGYIKATPVFANIPDATEKFDGDALPSKWSYASGASLGVDPTDSTNQVIDIDASVAGHNTIFYVDEKIANASVAVMEAKFYWTMSSPKAELYVYPNRGSGSTTDVMQMFYFNGGNITCYKNKGSDSSFSAGGASVGRWVDIRIEYRVKEVDGARVPEMRFYIDGVLRDVTNELRGGNYYNADGTMNSAKVPNPGEVDKFSFFFSSSVTSGHIYVDDVNFVHGTSVATTYENPEFDVVDFNSDYTSKLGTYTDNRFLGTTMGEANKNTWEVVYDDVSGDGALRLYKYGIDSPTYNGGVSLSPKVTYTEEGYNTMVMEIDLYMWNNGGTASELIVTQSESYAGTKNSPFLYSIPKVFNQWIHITIMYRPTVVDANGKVLEFESTMIYTTEDGKVVNYDSKSGAIADAYGANIVSGATPLPKLSTSLYFKFGFNNNFKGDAWVDNIGIKLINVEGKNPTVAQ